MSLSVSDVDHYVIIRKLLDGFGHASSIHMPCTLAPVQET
jgi:hypothetical protein